METEDAGPLSFVADGKKLWYLERGIFSFFHPTGSFEGSPLFSPLKTSSIPHFSLLSVIVYDFFLATDEFTLKTF